MAKTLIGQNINFKIVSFGHNINSVEPVTINYKAQNLLPYSPVYFNAVQNDSGDIVLSWVRRSREFISWRDHLDMPLGEISEKYVISILNDEDQVVREAETDLPSFNYNADMQIEDFGAEQNTLKTTVCQISQNAGRGGITEKTFNF